MLVIKRKPGEKLVIGDGITLTVVAVSGHQVRVGISAPEQVRILRGELAGRPVASLQNDDSAETAFA